MFPPACQSDVAGLLARESRLWRPTSSTHRVFVESTPLPPSVRHRHCQRQSHLTVAGVTIRTRGDAGRKTLGVTPSPLEYTSHFRPRQALAPAVRVYSYTGRVARSAARPARRIARTNGSEPAAYFRPRCPPYTAAPSGGGRERGGRAVEFEGVSTCRVGGNEGGECIQNSFLGSAVEGLKVEGE